MQNNIWRTLKGVIFFTFFYGSAPELPAADWLGNSQWDNGLAEVSLYQGKIIKYGKMRKSTFEMITVREYFSSDKLVKTSPTPGKKVIPVLKTNLTLRTRTGIYEYVQMASVFLERKTGKLIKLSGVSSEWCGNSFFLFENRNKHKRLIISNYMDDKGTFSISKNLEHIIFREQLIPYLRQNLETIREGATLKVANTLLTNNPVFAKNLVTVSKKSNIPFLPEAKKYGQVTTITLQLGTNQETFYIAQKGIRLFLRWENNKGEYYKLYKSGFLDYWNKNRAGDEKWLQK